jgi:hypothetical protein
MRFDEQSLRTNRAAAGTAAATKTVRQPDTTHAAARRESGQLQVYESLASLPTLD